MPTPGRHLSQAIWVAAEAAFDGIDVVRTNAPAETPTAEQVGVVVIVCDKVRPHELPPTVPCLDHFTSRVAARLGNLIVWCSPLPHELLRVSSMIKKRIPVADPSLGPVHGFLSRRTVLWAVGVLFSVCVVGGVFADWWISLPADRTATYVGRQSCIDCHRQEHALWQGSHHDLAMDVATEESVLGDFGDVEFTHFDVTSRFYRQDGKFMVRTEGPDGKLGDFEIKYVLGVSPLQQYMVEFDRRPDMPENEIARLQVLRLCWDTAKQEWFYLPPPDVDEKLAPDDVLHWTGVTMRWNTSCADCHSTNLQKNFDVATQTFHTTFSEIDVSCEACHGPGSLHVELAQSRSLFWDRIRGYGLTKLKGIDTRPQIETCAPCHSRRQGSLAAAFEPGDLYHDHYQNALLQSGLYHADGQILDEVFEYGSFVQSKMYHKGIRCTDCHDPHSTRLLHPGNQLCTSCHQHPAGKYDSPSHHRHAVGSAGAQCVACHMPPTTYMEVDPRHDHSLRVPRPDLSVLIGTPNACSGCHLDESGLSAERRAELGEYANWVRVAASGNEEVKTALARVDAWSDRWSTEWYGKPEEERADHFSLAIAEARKGNPASIPDLIRIVSERRQPALVRATCLAELGQFTDRRVQEVSLDLLNDPEPQVRAAALTNLRGLDLDLLLRKVLPLLDDPVRLVRVEAAQLLARVPPAELRGSQQRRLDEVLQEVEAGLLLNNDRAGAHLMLGVLHADQGDVERAVGDYETALRLEPGTVGPRSNLAELLDQRALELETQAAQLQQAEQQAAYGINRPAEPSRAGTDSRSERLLQAAFQFRQRVTQLRKDELELLARDVKLLPQSPPLRYRYGLLLYLNGREAEAEVELREACRLSPQSPDFAMALALLYQKQARYELALTEAQRLLALRPEDPIAQRLVTDLQQQAAAAARQP